MAGGGCGLETVLREVVVSSIALLTIVSSFFLE